MTSSEFMCICATGFQPLCALVQQDSNHIDSLLQLLWVSLAVLRCMLHKVYRKLINIHTTNTDAVAQVILCVSAIYVNVLQSDFILLHTTLSFSCWGKTSNSTWLWHLLVDQKASQEATLKCKETHFCFSLEDLEVATSKWSLRQKNIALNSTFRINPSAK